MDSKVWVCLGAGPSVTQAEIDACRDRSTVIAINYMYRYAPWADYLYGADYLWWIRPDVDGAKGFQGKKLTVSPEVLGHYPDVTLLDRTGREGFEPEPGKIRTGGHGGFAALHFAIQQGAEKVLLLGYDLQPNAEGRHHVHPEHPGGDHPCQNDKRMVYYSLLPTLEHRQIQVVNCSRATSLTTFPRGEVTTCLRRWT